MPSTDLFIMNLSHKPLLLITLMLLAMAIPAYCNTTNTAKDYVDSGLDKFLKDDFDGAIADYNKAIELQPNDAEAYFRRGQTDEGCRTVWLFARRRAVNRIRIGKVSAIPRRQRAPAGHGRTCAYGAPSCASS